jgi:hypothetical protein
VTIKEGAARLYGYVRGDEIQHFSGTDLVGIFERLLTMLFERCVPTTGLDGLLVLAKRADRPLGFHARAALNSQIKEALAESNEEDVRVKVVRQALIRGANEEGLPALQAMHLDYVLKSESLR